MRPLPREVALGLHRGIEKESLRATPAGGLALTPHAPALGSALTHPHITTDFSESQLELITGVHASTEACLEELERIHQFVYRNIGGEILWSASMPCGLPADDAIPIGRYGSSNSGRLKTVYRNGLAWRYGRRMQTISGIHYNFSLPGMTNESHFALIRNFRRVSWLPIFLFGASPAVCESFVSGRSHELETLSESSLFLPHATSLRMGRLGYQSDAQAKLAVSYNSLASYGASLYEALTVPYPPYEKIGIQGPDGEYRQLATSLLQIENEFYTTIRAKRPTRRGERPLHALRERGVEYVEVRLMDLDPFAPLGITAPTMRVLDLLLLHCHLSDSPDDSPQELHAIARNKLHTAQRGREPGLMLERGKERIALTDWGAQILGECEPIAAALDAALGGAAYRDALAAAQGVVREPESAPSARVLHAMARNHANSYVSFVLAMSLLHQKNDPMPPDAERYFVRLAEKSLEEQRKIEASDSVDFETYRARYLSPELLKL
ncbi:MAG TPA: glutamate--cysteine ligase [Burkholderiales bacterium]|nr:glutamate--cysteine ligase [Burkholderiales bacterium]